MIDIIIFLSLQNTPCLSGIELQQVGHIVQSQGKIIDLAETLEMTVDQTLLDDLHAGYEILKAWSEEMQEHASSLRVHLSYHLVTLGINDVANRYEFSCCFKFFILIPNYSAIV